MKRRVLTMLLILTLLLTGCGGKQTEADVAGKLEPAVTEPAETEPAVTESVETESVETEPAVTESVEAESVETEPTELEEKPVTMGRMEGGIYINEYTGYSFELNSDWTFYGAEELQQLPEDIKDLLADTEMGDALQEAVQFVDMLAENVNEMITVNVLYQKIDMKERVTYSLLSDEEILDATLKQKDMMIEAFAQSGMNIEEMDKCKVMFLGEERDAMVYRGTVQGIPYWQLQIFDYHLGQYGVTLTVSSYVEDKTQLALDLFKPIN